MTAVMLMPLTMPWPVSVVLSLITLLAVVLVARETGKRLMGALLIACVLAAPAILHAEEVIIGPVVCQLMPWLFECWFPWVF